MSLFLIRLKQQIERAAKLYVAPAPIKVPPERDQAEFDFDAPASVVSLENTVVLEEVKPKKINKKKAK